MSNVMDALQNNVPSLEICPPKNETRTLQSTVVGMDMLFRFNAGKVLVGSGASSCADIPSGCASMEWGSFATMKWDFDTHSELKN